MSNESVTLEGIMGSGSYNPDDVLFLLKKIDLQPTDVEEKERLIQSGEKHYSEMISLESAPTTEHMSLFKHALSINAKRMAAEVLGLADALIREIQSGPIVLVSLVRAGIPLGVLLKRALSLKNRLCHHYGISIIRDRGMDRTALNAITRKHGAENIVFVDGWTGKGVISTALEESIARYNQRKQVNIHGGLFVLVDLAGCAAVSASGEDYLIPSSILNATVSGLVSRSVLNEQVGVNDFHGCIYYQEFAAQDQSQAFAKAIIADALALAKDTTPSVIPADKRQLAAVSSAFLAQAMAEYHIDNINFIKPGIGEATRVLLRRMARLLILRDPTAADVAHLQVLAEQKSIPIIIQPNLPYQAVSLIGSALDG